MKHRDHEPDFSSPAKTTTATPRHEPTPTPTPQPRPAAEPSEPAAPEAPVRSKIDIDAEKSAKNK